MTNSAKTPSGKTSKGKVSIYVEKGRIKARLPRQYFGGEQPRIALGMDANDANMARAQRLAERMTLDLQDGCFDETLAKYGIVADLKLKGTAITSDGQLPPKPELSLLEVWDMYCEYRKPGLRESTLVNHYQGTYKKLIENACFETKGEEAMKIRNWMVSNRNLKNAKKVLSGLSKAYQLLIKRGFCTFNPYDGLADEIKVKGAKGKTKEEIEITNDNDVLDKSKAYTWNEAQEILNYIQNRKQVFHYYHFIKFKFLTGCRTGEAIAFMHGDIFWDKQEIVIRRTYDEGTKKLFPLKNAKSGSELSRIFPMPNDGELWNLLKSIPQGEPNEIVFKSKMGKIINRNTLGSVWRGNSQGHKGIIPELIEQGKLAKYLPPYNTRHTFITHQVYDLGRDEKIVSAWCGHGEFVSQKHYQDTAKYAMQINPELPANNNQSTEKSEVELLKEQNIALAEQMEQMKKMIEQLTKDKQ